MDAHLFYPVYSHSEPLFVQSLPHIRHSSPQDTQTPHDDPPPDEEPLYVNAKQYFRILKRRVARARLEEVHRLSRQRKVRIFISSQSLPGSFRSPISTSLATSMRCGVLAVPAVAFSPRTRSLRNDSLSATTQPPPSLLTTTMTTTTRSTTRT